MKAWRRHLLLTLMIASLPMSLWSADVSEKMAKLRERNKAYTRGVIAAIQEHWSLPPSYAIADKKLQATLHVRTDERARIADYHWVKKSPDEIFNEACLKAIQSTKKLPTPPPHIALFVTKEGFDVHCKPNAISLGASPDRCSALSDKSKFGQYKEWSDFPQEPYIYELRSLIRKKYRAALHRENARISDRMTGVTDRAEVEVGFSIDQHGDIKHVEIICPSQIAYFDEMIKTFLERIRAFPKPPEAILDSNRLLKLKWGFTVYDET